MTTLEQNGNKYWDEFIKNKLINYAHKSQREDLIFEIILNKINKFGDLK